MRSSLNHVAGITDAKELHFKQGQLSALSTIINFENAIRNAYDVTVGNEE